MIIKPRKKKVSKKKEINLVKKYTTKKLENLSERDKELQERYNRLRSN